MSRTRLVCVQVPNWSLGGKAATVRLSNNMWRERAFQKIVGRMVLSLLSTEGKNRFSSPCKALNFAFVKKLNFAFHSRDKTSKARLLQNSVSSYTLVFRWRKIALFKISFSSLASASIIPFLLANKINKQFRP